MLTQHIRYLTARYSDEHLQILHFTGKEDLEGEIGELSELQMSVIDMTEETNVLIAKRIRALCPDVQILVIADTQISPMKYLTPSIRPSALLLRGSEMDQWQQVVEDYFVLAIQKYFRKDSGFLWVKTRDGTQKILHSYILYCEAREKKIFIRTEKVEYGIGSTIENLMKELPDNFIRCHRSYIVNGDYIERIRLSEGLLYLVGKLTIPVSRSYKSSLKEYMDDRNKREE